MALHGTWLSAAHEVDADVDRWQPVCEVERWWSISQRGAVFSTLGLPGVSHRDLEDLAQGADV